MLFPAGYDVVLTSEGCDRSGRCLLVGAEGIVATFAPLSSAPVRRGDVVDLTIILPEGRRISLTKLMISSIAEFPASETQHLELHFVKTVDSTSAYGEWLTKKKHFVLNIGGKTMPAPLFPIPVTFVNTDARSVLLFLKEEIPSVMILGLFG